MSGHSQAVEMYAGNFNCFLRSTLICKSKEAIIMIRLFFVVVH